MARRMRLWHLDGVRAGALAGMLVSMAVAIVSVAIPALGQDAQQSDQELTVYTSFAEFGEPQYPEDFTHFEFANPDAPKGGSITLGAFGTFERLDTITLGGAWPLGIALTQDSLMTGSLQLSSPLYGSSDELATYYPLIAESVAVPDDLSFAVFTVNPAARYHDGEPITAGDFEYVYDVIMEHGRPFLRAFLEEITDATALDDRRIRYDFATRDSWKPIALIAGFSPLPRHYWEAEGRDVSQAHVEPALYNGPYRIARVNPGVSITYERVEDYWAADLPVNVGHYNFDRITYDYFRDLDARFLAFTGGDLDLMIEGRAQRWATGYDFPAVSSGDVILDTPPDNIPRGIRSFIINGRRPPFDDPPGSRGDRLSIRFRMDPGEHLLRFLPADPQLLSEFGLRHFRLSLA